MTNNPNNVIVFWPGFGVPMIRRLPLPDLITAGGFFYKRNVK